MNINIHIERLVLDGLPITRIQGEVVRAAVEARLTQLLKESEFSLAWQSDIALPKLNADVIRLAERSTPTLLGSQIAQSVYGGLRL